MLPEIFCKASTVPGLDTKPPGDDDENLGLELAAGNFNGDGYLGRPCVDLAMAVSEATGPLPSGAVYVVNGSPDGLRPATAQHLSQGETLADGTKIDNISEPYDAFGAHMTITHADVDRFDDLVIGTFNEDDQAGAAHVLRGSAGGVSAQGQAFWQQAKGGIPGQQQFSPWGSMFGWSVGGTSNGVIVAGAASYSFLNVPSPPGCGGVGNPCSFSNEPQAGWAAIVRVDDKNPIGIGNVFEATEATLSANAPTPLSVTSGSFFGRVILGPRPAFVPVTDAPRYAGSLTLASGYGLRRPCDVDVSAPVLSDVTVTPACLWPPNHKLVAYSLKTNVQVTVHDNCDSSPVVRISSVTSSEPSKSGAAFVFGPTRACLRSERSGPNGNRTYTITLEALDASGNIGTATVDVKVPLSATSGCFVDPALFVKDGDARCAF